MNMNLELGANKRPDIEESVNEIVDMNRITNNMNQENIIHWCQLILRRIWLRMNEDKSYQDIHLHYYLLSPVQELIFNLFKRY